MKADSKRLLTEFIQEASGQFVIPVYQRNYTWTVKKQIKPLLEDLERLLQHPNQNHYLGSIVYLNSQIDFSLVERSVVDGQQRLVTTFLILHALRNIFEDKGNIDAYESLTLTYLENQSKTKESRYRYRLYPSVADEQSYKKIAEGRYSEVEEMSSSNIVKNFIYLKGALLRLLDQYGEMKLLDALSRFYIVYIQLEETDDAQQIFESINSKGERLSVSDLIRNYIMMNKTNEEQTNLYNKYWLQLEEVFPSPKRMEEFFRYYLASKTFKITSIKNLYEEFKGYWRSLPSNKETEFLNEIVRFSKYYNTLYLANNKNNFTETLNDFRAIDSKVPAPFLMYFMEMYEYNKLITSKQMEGILQTINTYLMRRYFHSEDTDVLSKSFPSFLKIVLTLVESNGYDEIVPIVQYVLINKNQQNKMFMPNDEQLNQSMRQMNAYSMGLTKWLFGKMETTNNSIYVDINLLTIEHIMPQTINDYWRSITNIDEDRYAILVNRIGNLTLSSHQDNARMGNRNFETKKKVLEDTSHLKINQPILKKEIWTIDEIEQRTKEIISRFISLFPYVKSEKNYEFDDAREVQLQWNEADAKGYLQKNDHLKIYRGSTLVDCPLEGYDINKLRQKLIDEDIIKPVDGFLTFVDDYEFNSPSQAASIVKGGAQNGWRSWHTMENIQIGDVFRNR